MKLTRHPERQRLSSREVLGTAAEEALPFDPEREITPEDCARIRGYIETQQQFNNTSMIWMFCVLFPDQVDSLKEKSPVLAYESTNAEGYADELTTLKLLRPNEFKQKKYKHTALHERLKVVFNQKLRTKAANKWDHWADVAICFKTLFPEDRSLQLSAEQLAEVNQEIGWDNPAVRKFKLWELAKFTLLFPQDFSAPRLEPEEWTRVRQDIDELRQQPSSVYGLTYTLFAAKILAAEHAEIDNQGNVAISPPAPRPLAAKRPLPARDQVA